MDREFDTLKSQGHEIVHVDDKSIAVDLGLKPGDHVLSLNGKTIADIFDFHFWQLNEQLTLTVLTAEGQLIEFDIEKDADEGLGLSFADDMLGDCRTCHNNCVFCFIDQLPEGMRDSLYVKDDDLRMSFLNGNYVTLTNMSDEELDRLIEYRLSPMNISVHTTDPDLRRLMMRHKKAGSIMQRLQQIAKAGLVINAQIVLCPGLNDGPALEKTLSDLVSLGSSLGSAAVVPVGLTRFRKQNKLYPLTPVHRQSALETLAIIEKWQSRLLAASGSRKVFAADELYLIADKPLPSMEAYEDFPQLENGIGMAAQTLHQIKKDLDFLDTQQLDSADKDKAKQPVVLVTGTSFAPLLHELAERMQKQLKLPVIVKAVKNDLLGHTITVSGLLAGCDIISQTADLLSKLQNETDENVSLILPSNLLRAGTKTLLDDLAVSDISRRLKVPVEICEADGSGLVDSICRLAGRCPGFHAGDDFIAADAKGESDHE